MTPAILHEYPLSLYAEKVRRILAYKKIAWRSVEQPMMMPKPELTALTGGYRRVPVLQLGADVYCDTACIARRLERLRPEPTCFPPQHAALSGLIADWAERRLNPLLMPPVIIELLPILPPDILLDRGAMSPLLSKPAILAAAPMSLRQAPFALDRLERLLHDRRFVLGDTFSFADAACFHPIWFLKRSRTLFAAVGARPALAAWFARIESFGPGEVHAMSAAEALAIARESEPTDIEGQGRTSVEGLTLGDEVTVAADDYGPEGSRGTVVDLTPDEITIQRRDPALGTLAVHFPRAGYRVEKG